VEWAGQLVTVLAQLVIVTSAVVRMVTVVGLKVVETEDDGDGVTGETTEELAEELFWLAEEADEVTVDL